jgi:hypothetical protein
MSMFHSLRPLSFFGKKKFSLPRGRRRREALTLEHLEDRCLPSTITVLTNADNNGIFVGGPNPTDTTLRGALANAVNGDSIVFQSSTLSGTTITLGASYGSLTIAKNVTIAGLGASSLAISGANVFEVLKVNSGFTATVSGLTITGGFAGQGGGIANAGNLTLNACSISGNSATSIGGGI